MKPIKTSLHIDTSPHIFSDTSVPKIMRHVVYALIPMVGFAFYCYGWSALLIIGVCVISCLLTEHWLSKRMALPSGIGDGSAVITGLLLGLTLPPALPLWMAALGGIVSIGLGKMLFGGLGCNVFNPALVGRAFLQAAFPSSLTTFSPPFSPDRFHSIADSVLTPPLLSPSYDSLSSATPLSAFKFGGQSSELNSLFLGTSNGSLGETSAALILMCGLYLIFRNFMNWRIPAGIFIAVFALSSLFHWLQPQQFAGPWFMLCSGGLMLGALFMATDMVASPLSHRACFVYGVLIGALVVVIRYWSGLPEGVMYAILFCNALSPHIDRLLQPKPFSGQSP
ncbi:MAG: RnfABCDGE type electron transport complex subunit D [Gammaproteobacteria bacterium]|nr:RnfABCDGE type electron transport complex subunit D [Gammaproteobacteria bacterium]MDH5802944.1 RnfABCDGE type electron transport complex subunit D [Gammaproteobacteria bacterium]